MREDKAARDIQLSELWHGAVFILYAAWIFFFNALQTQAVYSFMIQIAPATSWALLYLAIGLLRLWGMWRASVFTRLLASYSGTFLWVLTFTFALIGNIHSLLVPSWLVWLASSVWVHSRLTVLSRQAGRGAE